LPDSDLYYYYLFIFFKKKTLKEHNGSFCLNMREFEFNVYWFINMAVIIEFEN